MPRGYIASVGDISAASLALVQRERAAVNRDVCVVIGIDGKWAAGLRLCQRGGSSIVAARNFGDNQRPSVTVFDTMDTVPPKVYAKLLTQLRIRGRDFVKQIKNREVKNRFRLFLDSL